MDKTKEIKEALKGVRTTGDVMGAVWNILNGKTKTWTECDPCSMLESASWSFYDYSDVTDDSDGFTIYNVYWQWVNNKNTKDIFAEYSAMEDWETPDFLENIEIENIDVEKL